MHLECRVHRPFSLGLPRRRETSRKRGTEETPVMHSVAGTVTTFNRGLAEPRCQAAISQQVSTSTRPVCTFACKYPVLHRARGPPTGSAPSVSGSHSPSSAPQRGSPTEWTNGRTVATASHDSASSASGQPDNSPGNILPLVPGNLPHPRNCPSLFTHRSSGNVRSSVVRLLHVVSRMTCAIESIARSTLHLEH